MIYDWNFLKELEDSRDAMIAPPTALTVSELTLKVDGSDDING